ncbi:MAG: hypothetical protein H6597_02615 [Flavobacteriales bacterium]|nr:hypothetical protein [Flavobacteriales bacterium]MCB9193398.1 hypothetical protein [Flavobacteriales bacterium]
MRGSSLLLAVLLFGGSQAQTLRVPAANGPIDQPHFDPEFIRRACITMVKGRNAVKREQEPIRDLDQCHLYRFDRNGRTIYQNTSFGRPGTGTDTASTVMTFDTMGHLVQELHNDLNGFYAIETSYDSLGRTTRRTYVRIVNLGPDRYHFEPGDRTVITDERSIYRQLNDTVLVRTHLNELDLPFLEETTVHDRWGYLRSIEDRYLITGRRSRAEFHYNEKGRLAERTLRSDLSSTHVLRQAFHYDAIGDLMAMDEFHDDELVSHEEYLYEEGTMFLKAKLTKDMSTGTIHLVRYTTERIAP